MLNSVHIWMAAGSWKRRCTEAYSEIDKTVTLQIATELLDIPMHM